jgi:hypothetical protein
MRLDHVSYVASHDQISDVVNRIGSQIDTSFIDGGIHPKFGTRNFTAPLLNRQYIEVVCPMDHPATDTTPFGKAVKNKAEEGGGWFAWVFASSQISDVEQILGREAIIGKRRKPNGDELVWKQIGVSDLLNSPENPFFIQWENGEHPSLNGQPKANLCSIEINGNIEEVVKTLDFDLTESLAGVELYWNKNFLPEKNVGIQSINFNIENRTVSIF